MTSQAGLPDETATLYRLQVRGIRDYAMFLTDVHGSILTWNKGVQELLGYSEEEFIGKNASIIFTPEDRAANVPATEMQRAREEGQAQIFAGTNARTALGFILTEPCRRCERTKAC